MNRTNMLKLLQVGGPSWAIEKTWLDAMLAGDMGGSMPQSPQARIIAGIAIVPLYGPLTTSGFDMEMGFGTSTVEATAQVRAATSSPAVSHILLDVNSPGGAVPGTAMLADAVYNARGKKPVTALANFQMGSAAYWIASQANEVVVVPQGEVGSIGVWMVHMDMSGALEQAGMKPTIFHAGKYKVEGHPFGPLDDNASEEIQSRVNEHYLDFLQAVARGRSRTPKSVAEGFGEGRMVRDRRAVALGMADRVESIETLMGRIAKRKATSPDARATANWLGDARAMVTGITPDPERDPAVLRKRLTQKVLSWPIADPEVDRRRRALDAKERAFASRADAHIWRATR